MPTDPLAGGQGTGSQPDAVLDEVSVAETSVTTQSDKGKPSKKEDLVPVKDLRNLQSIYDKKLAQAEQRYAEMAEQFKQLQEWREKNETAGLSDEELAAYQAEKAMYETNQERQKYQQQMAALEYERNKLTLQTYYRNMGAPETVFESEEPADWQDTFIKHLKAEADRAKAELAKVKGGTTDKAPAVTTHKPAAASLGKIKFSELKLGSPEEAQFFAKLDAGLIKPEDVDFT